MFKFPWGDFHSLNLGWFLQKFNELCEDWATAEAGIDGALDAEIQKAEDALTDVFAARDAAAASASAANSSALNASQSSLASMDARDQSRAARDAAQQAATNAAASETAAGNSATAASNSAGAAATSATQAGLSATAAGNSAAAAAESEQNVENIIEDATTEAIASATQTATTAATNAANSETAAGNSATAAGNSATAANNSGLAAEGFSQGTQNGTPVPSTSPYYQNNAKYFSELSENFFNTAVDYIGGFDAAVFGAVSPATGESTANNRTFKKIGNMAQCIGASSPFSSVATAFNITGSVFTARSCAAFGAIADAEILDTDFSPSRYFIGTPGPVLECFRNPRGGANNIIIIGKRIENDSPVYRKVTITANMTLYHIIAYSLSSFANYDDIAIYIQSANNATVNNFSVWFRFLATGTAPATLTLGAPETERTELEITREPS